MRAIVTSDPFPNVRVLFFGKLPGSEAAELVEFDSVKHLAHAAQFAVWNHRAWDWEQSVERPTLLVVLIGDSEFPTPLPSIWAIKRLGWQVAEQPTAWGGIDHLPEGHKCRTAIFGLGKHTSAQIESILAAA